MAARCEGGSSRSSGAASKRSTSWRPSSASRTTPSARMLDLLEREGIVAQARVRRDGAVGKPATLYSIAPRANATLSAAYAPVLTALAASLRERMPRRDLEALYRDAGRRLAESQDESGARGFEKRVRGAAELPRDARRRVGRGASRRRVHPPGTRVPIGRRRPRGSVGLPGDPRTCVGRHRRIRSRVLYRDGESPKCRLEIRRSA